jgi:hypothetical protein
MQEEVHVKVHEVVQAEGYDEVMQEGAHVKVPSVHKAMDVEVHEGMREATHVEVVQVEVYDEVHKAVGVECTR